MARVRPELMKKDLGPMPQPNSIMPFTCWLLMRPLSVLTTLMHSYPQGQHSASGSSKNNEIGTWFSLSFDDDHFDNCTGADIVYFIGLPAIDVDKFDFSIFCSHEHQLRTEY
jgi:hypothetical protein